MILESFAKLLKKILSVTTEDVKKEDDKKREGKNKKKRSLHEFSSNDKKERKKEFEHAIKKINKEWEDTEESLQMNMSSAPTLAEMEAYKLTKIYADDPMAAFIKEKHLKKHSKKD
uniref:Uncharacterized protein n=1 Tax=Wuchereria bancrofti TaxID=6293 RepID=A0A1I8EQB5_WUCBA